MFERRISLNRRIHNELSHRQKLMFANATVVVFSPDVSRNLIKDADERLTDEEFYEKFSDDILTPYALPTGEARLRVLDIPG